MEQVVQIVIVKKIMDEFEQFEDLDQGEDQDQECSYDDLESGYDSW